MDVVSLETFTSIVLGCQEGPGEEETRHTLKIMLKAIEALRQETQARKRFEVQQAFTLVNTPISNLKSNLNLDHDHAAVRSASNGHS